MRGSALGPPPPHYLRTHTPIAWAGILGAGERAEINGQCKEGVSFEPSPAPLPAHAYLHSMGGDIGGGGEG